MIGDIMVTELLGSVSGTQGSTSHTTGLGEQLKQFPGHVVDALIIEALITISQSTGSTQTITDPVVVANILRRLTLPPLRTASGDVEAWSVQGADVAAFSALAGWRDTPLAHQTDADVTMSEDDFPAFSITSGSSTARLVRWVIPYALPYRGKHARDTSPSVGDMPLSASLLWATNAELTTDAGFTCTYTVSYRVVGLLSSFRNGTAVAAPISFKREENITEAQKVFPKGNWLFAWLEFDAAATITNVISELSRPGSLLKPARDARYYDMWAALRAGRPSLPKAFEPPTAATTSTAKRIPLIATAPGAKMSEIETAGVAYKLRTAATHSFLGIRIVPPAGKPLKTALARSRVVAGHEGRKLPAAVLPKARASASNVLHKVGFLAQTENDLRRLRVVGAKMAGAVRGFTDGDDDDTIGEGDGA